MSLFDPYHLYDRRTRSSHAGQVLRKKIPSSLGQCFTNDQIDTFIKSLTERGYLVFPPGTPLPSPPPETKQLEHTIIYPGVDVGLLSYTSSTQYELQFRQVWNQAYSDFSDILAIDSSRISSFNFEYSLISYIFGGDETYQGSTGTAIFFVQYTPGSFGSTYQMDIDGSDSCFGDISFSEQRKFHFDDSSLANESKADFNDVRYLAQVSTNSMSDYVAIKERNYDAFDPVILTWGVSFLNGPTSFTLNVHGVCLAIKMSIQYV